ncbi:8069_t:CDS:2, partial [Acaulospora morrowiae]
ILYISIQSLSILLSLSLVIIFLRSPPFVTKWTIIQICISVLGYSIFSLPSLMIYGDQVQSKAFNTPLLAYGVQNTVKGRKRYVAVVFDRNLGVGNSVQHSSVVVHEERKTMGCDGYMVVLQMLECRKDVVHLLFLYWDSWYDSHSTYILYSRWQTFNRQPNRRTAINLGHSVRVAIYTNFLLIMAFVYVISDCLTPKKVIEDVPPWTDSTVYVGDFTSAFSGTLLFLVFGTTRRAALFLPCCYYSPPEVLVFPDSERRLSHRNNTKIMKSMNSHDLYINGGFEKHDEHMNGEYKKDNIKLCEGCRKANQMCKECNDKQGGGNILEGNIAVNDDIDKKWLSDLSKPLKKVITDPNDIRIIYNQTKDIQESRKKIKYLEDTDNLHDDRK